MQYSSFFNEILNKIINKILKIFEISKSYIIFNWFIKKIKQSLIWSWILKPEKEIDIFEKSLVVTKIVKTGSKAVEKGERYVELSFIQEIRKSLEKEINVRPIFLASLIILVATLTNTILWLILREFEISGFLIRLILIMMAIVGFTMKTPLDVWNSFKNRKLVS